MRKLVKPVSFVNFFNKVKFYVKSCLGPTFQLQHTAWLKLNLEDKQEVVKSNPDPKYVGVRPLSDLEKQLLKSKEDSEAKLRQLEKEIEEVKRSTLEQKRKLEYHRFWKLVFWRY